MSAWKRQKLLKHVERGSRVCLRARKRAPIILSTLPLPFLCMHTSSIWYILNIFLNVFLKYNQLHFSKHYSVYPAPPFSLHAYIIQLLECAIPPLSVFNVYLKYAQLDFSKDYSVYAAPSLSPHACMHLSSIWYIVECVFLNTPNPTFIALQNRLQDKWRGA